MNNRLARFKKTASQGTIGGIAGFIAERGLESLTGMDFVDGVLEIAGITLGMASANRDLIKQSYTSVVEVTGKEPAELTPAEWEDVRNKYPRAVEYLERALALK